jgi:putative tryptophan/tyrosine transport system substrate-binding protein
MSHMRRREFITLLGGALTSWPILANAQPAARTRTVGVLIGLADDAEARSRLIAFEQGLETEGWSLGQTLRIEYRYAEGDSARMQAFAKELVGAQAGLHRWPQHARCDRAEACDSHNSHRLRVGF